MTRTKLTPKQEEIFTLHKLSALMKLLKHFECILPSESELKRRNETYPYVARRALLGICDMSATPLKRTACCALLEYFVPDWRDYASQELIGMVAERGSTEDRKWKKDVFHRDRNKCVKCGAVEYLEAHHIIRWIDAPFLRVVVNNGETLCNECHKLEKLPRKQVTNHATIVN